MNRSYLRSLADDAPGGLRTIAVPAPPTLADDVLVEIGLADRMAPIDSPLGTLWVAWNGRGVSEVEQAADGTRGRSAPRRPDRPADVRRRVAPPALLHAITRRLAGERRVRIPLDLRGRTEFEVAVWTKALEIPRGEVRPYGWIAAEIGRPKAVRAVGTALGHNPVPLIVPCHRVVRTDGTIGQYSLGGPGNKRTILSAEGLDPTAMEAAARGGERLSGSTTTRIVCWPTCRHARRVQDRYRVSFRSLGEAAGQGLPAVQDLPPGRGRSRRLRRPRRRRPRIWPSGLAQGGSERLHSPPSVSGEPAFEMRPSASPIAVWAGLIVLYLVWGSTYLGIKVAVETVPPFVMGFIRFVPAGILLAGAVACATGGPSSGRAAGPSPTP